MLTWSACRTRWHRIMYHLKCSRLSRISCLKRKLSVRTKRKRSRAKKNALRESKCIKSPSTKKIKWLKNLHLKRPLKARRRNVTQWQPKIHTKPAKTASWVPFSVASGALQVNLCRLKELIQAGKSHLNRRRLRSNLIQGQRSAEMIMISLLWRKLTK